MADKAGSVRKKFHSHIVIETVLVVALALYMLIARHQAVGEDLVFTVAGAGLMALVTYWTLNTLRDGLEVIAMRSRRSRA
ncbi:hypothetical protein QQF73_12380 [Marinobacter sp. M216]|uniref:Chlorhexidine efflux transporter domain-containing protein n=1 Tax=Marinobacter albus TaxID=3030833 RepID=A0ABT7HDH3_9GAMM|nr:MULTISPECIES: hypothetical protein [unclassified Marinobacter]MBW7471851.1 hypothetical protein [Marinobacter sp. F4218]MDK9558421.1 hypothetical protein [Marinobacter sp. M216]